MNKPPLNYIEMGNGETILIFLHFFGGSSKSWLPVMDQLKNSFKCIAIDLRGFGDSPKPEKTLSVNENADDVFELIQQLKINNFILIGHSMGGKIAMAIAARKLTGLTFLILVAPSPPTPEPTTEDNKKQMLATFNNRAAVQKLIQKITVKQLPVNLLEEVIEDHLKISAAAWDGWINEGSEENISDLIINICVPIKVISGGSDPNFSTVFLKEIFTAYFTDATVEEIKSTGHLIPLEVPNELVASLKNYLKN